MRPNIDVVRFHVLTAMSMKMAAFWDVGAVYSDRY
jgi:hypothetical protein